MSGLQNFLRRASSLTALYTHHIHNRASIAGRQNILLLRTPSIQSTILSHLPTIVTPRYFSTSIILSIYAKRTPRPKQRVIKEQKLKHSRTPTSTVPSPADRVLRSKTRQWTKTEATAPSPLSGRGAISSASKRKRIMSTSVSVTSLEKGSRNPQFEHSFAPGFASAYRAKLRAGVPLKTGNAGRDKAAAAEKTLMEAGAKRKSGPNVRGFVPVRFALKPIASDVNLKLVSTRKIPTSKYQQYLGAAGGTTQSTAQEPLEPVFARTQESVKEMMQKVANSRFEEMGIHPDVQKGISELLAKTGTSSATAMTSPSEGESKKLFSDIRPTEIQAMAIPATIDVNKKSPYTLCAAETGSGKTLAYLVPLLHDLKVQEDQAVQAYKDEGGIDEEGRNVRALNMIRQFNQPRAIVLLPSRELVAQVSGILKQLSHSVKVRILTISHSMSPRSVIQRLADGPVDIVVATPASLLDYLPKTQGKNHRGAKDEEEEHRRMRGSAGLFDEGRLSLSSLRHLVIDEADSMFDRGFGSEVTKIVQQAKTKSMSSSSPLPTKITVVSATLPKKVSDTLDEVLPGMLKITTPSLHKSLPGLHQTFLDLKPYFGNRPKAILDILAKQQQIATATGGKRQENTLIFCNTKHSCEILHSHLKANKVPGVLGVLHGDATNRDEILEQFTNDEYVAPPPPTSTSTSTKGSNSSSSGGGGNNSAGKQIPGGKILISTDIASRGIDTTVVQHVVLYDFPVTIVDYLHRVGRTARGGRGGRATSLVGRKDRNMAERIMTGIRLGKVLS
ncbi:RNA helicase [Podila humilis]|nr:RNA helicase [Podila humilis]